eukprot:gene1112-463_t
MSKVGDALGVECGREPIKACHRISPKKDSAIICKFKSRTTRDLLMAKKKDLHGVTGDSLGLKNLPAKIFINESLTRKKKLFRLVREKKKKGVAVCLV